MKGPQSNLITAFLWAVRSGAIVAPDRCGKILESMTVAMEAILQGVDPESALQITRNSGRELEPETLDTAARIHELRTAGEKWEVVTILVNADREKRGAQPITRIRMREIYGSLRPVMEVREFWEQMMAPKK